MAKYLTEFNTYADYSGATLSLPNVSLIKSTGEVYYKNIFAGAVAGDVLMWDVANSVFKLTIGGVWDSTLYPIADYVPIAVNAIPSSETSDGVARWISLKDLGSLRWGVYGTLVGGISDQNALSGRNYTDTVLNFTGYNASEYAAFNAVNTYVTSGTTAGDWFLPSLGELKLTYNNKVNINASLTAIHTASSNIANTFTEDLYLSSSENDKYAAFKFNLSNGYINGMASKTLSTNSYVRAFLML